MTDDKTGKKPGGRLDNPLPEPVAGRRQELEFPIMDTGDGKWPHLSDASQFEFGEDLRDAREDDFDIRISDADDFDI